MGDRMSQNLDKQRYVHLQLLSERGDKINLCVVGAGNGGLSMAGHHSKPILPIDWAFILGAGLVIFLVMELEKKMQFKTNGRSR